MNTNPILTTRDLALICAKQLNAMLDKREFDINNPQHIASADQLWRGALLARAHAKAEQP